jgi:hypothetical protein
MIEIDKVKFESVVTAAACANVQVFEAMNDALQAAQRRVVNDVAPESVIEAASEELQNEVVRYVCLDAFYRQIPQLDLVLTPTGFGVVSNQNVAPASRDRVSALQDAIRNERDDSLDSIISMLLGNEAWASTVQAAKMVPSLMFLAEQVRDFAGMDGHRTDLVALRAKIGEAEQKITEVCSMEQYYTFIEHIRKGSCSPDEEKVILSARRAIGYHLNGLWGGFKKELDYISNYLEGNLEQFKEYADSQVYKIKHYKRYENKREDPTYFFG